MLRVALTFAMVALGAPLAAQTPAPFPRPADQQPAPKAPAGTPVAPAQPAAAQASDAPTEASLGMPLYPAAEFITSYNAGRGQRYYLFGTNSTFAEIVAYYRTVLKQRGELVYDEPPIHMFDVGRFREDTMAFPPGVTVKDYTWGGSLGYLNPRRGADPQRFRTIIQIVPPPRGTER
ncbi:MAG TPA: hypothetical protein VD833_13455 [Vicinamibacterales bacterium]|nr:hypothetical protein [Vicinamibacterales bacterium]